MLDTGFFTNLEMEGTQALFEGKLQGLVASLYMNERPLQGLAGLIDWHFHGRVSEYIRRGLMTGEAGECAYVPLEKGGKTYHLFFVGAGVSDDPGARNELPTESLAAIKNNLKTLKIEKIGISKHDFGAASEDYLSKKFKGVPICVLQ